MITTHFIFPCLHTKVLSSEHLSNIPFYTLLNKNKKHTFVHTHMHTHTQVHTHTHTYTHMYASAGDVQLQTCDHIKVFSSV